MTDLKCAREEMLYLTATHQVSNPIKDWKWPSAEELETYYEKIHELNRSPLTADDFCENGSLGFYMVTISF